MEPKLLDSESTGPLASSADDDYEQVKDDFATKVLSQNPELMKSMNDIFFSQHYYSQHDI